MSVMLDLWPSTRVKITADAGVCIGRIEEIGPPEALPAMNLYDTPGEGTPAAVLKSMGVTRMAMISYHYTRYTDVLFAAVEIGGEWFDLNRQALHLEIIGQYGDD